MSTYEHPEATTADVAHSIGSDAEFSLATYPPMPSESTEFAEQSRANEYPPSYSRTQRIGMKATAVFATLSTVLSIGGHIYAGDAELAPKLAIGYFTEEGPGSVPTSTVRHVDALLDGPETPQIKNDFGIPQATSLKGIAAREKAWAKAYHAYCLQEAEKHGLHLIDETPYVHAVQKAQTVNEIQDVLNRFTMNYGFSVEPEYHMNFEDIGLSAIPLKHDELSVAKFRYGAEQFMGALFYMPEEIARYADIREEKIVDNLGARRSGTIGGFQPSAETNPITGVLYFPIEAFYGGDFETIMHEISHRVDYRMSGNWGMYRDKQFRDLNDPDFRYGDPHSPDFKRDLADPYSGTNPVEDKATLYENMLNGLDPDMFLNASPVIRDKYRLLVERLDQRIPGIADYLSAISSHTRD